MQQLGRYEVLGKLGEGAMGTVYRAFDPLLERIVAIKTIKLDLTPAEREDFEARFFKEAKSAARLNHPAIVTVFDAGKEDDVAYIAMECLQGKDLRQMIQKVPTLSHPRMAEIAATVADGLDYAHRNGVVHRDVKPANIMVLDNGSVKIADFGIAQLQNSAKTLTGQVLGTPKYMSPEQITGVPVDGRSDIFSLGVVLYQMLTSISPFESSSVSAIMYKVIHEPAMLPSLIARDVPRGFEYILARALAKKPEDRYQTAAEMAADLRRYPELNAVVDIPWEGSALAKPEAGAGHPGSTSGAGEKTEACPGNDAEKTVALAPSSQPPPTGQKKPVNFLVAGFFVAAALIATIMLRQAPLPETPPAANQEAPPTPAPSPASEAPVQEPLPATARISLAIAPWGEILVDGKSEGIAPPLNEIILSAGKHHIEIRNTGNAPLKLDIALEANETRKIKHKFKDGS